MEGFYSCKIDNTVHTPRVFHVKAPEHEYVFSKYS